MIFTVSEETFVTVMDGKARFMSSRHVFEIPLRRDKSSSYV